LENNYEIVKENCSRKIVFDALKFEIELDEEALKKFEETREEAWKDIKEKYIKKGLIE